MADDSLPIIDDPAGASPARFACPFCASNDTELFSLFSQFLLASQYYCRSCQTVFDVVRWADPPDPTSGPARPAGLPQGEASSSGSVAVPAPVPSADGMSGESHASGATHGI